MLSVLNKTMDAFQVYPVLISKIPIDMTVDQLHSNAFTGVCMEHKASLLYLSDASINSKQQYLMLFKSLSAQLAMMHSINSKSNKHNSWNTMAMIPRTPFLPQQFHKPRWKELVSIKNYKYSDPERKDQGADEGTSYNFKNCLAVEIMKRMPRQWALLPVTPDVWHLVMSSDVVFKRDDPDLSRMAVTVSSTFRGVVLDPDDESRASVKHCYRGHLFGLVWNQDWDCQHPFGLKADFVDKQKLLTDKKASFKISLSHSTIKNHDLKSIFHLKPNPFSFATSVQIMAKRNSLQKQPPRNDAKPSAAPSPPRQKLRSWRPNQGMICAQTPSVSML